MVDLLASKKVSVEQTRRAPDFAVTVEHAEETAVVVPHRRRTWPPGFREWVL
jgi:hypothetical protein